MGERITKATADKLSASLKRAGDAEIARDKRDAAAKAAAAKAKLDSIRATSPFEGINYSANKYKKTY